MKEIRPTVLVLTYHECGCGDPIHSAYYTWEAAEKDLLKMAVRDLDDCEIPAEQRWCNYDSDGHLIEICETNGYEIDWIIHEVEILDGKRIALEESAERFLRNV